MSDMIKAPAHYTEGRKYEPKDVIREIWRDVAGYEGYYQVSTVGRVRSLNRIIKRANNSPVLRKGVMLTPQKDKDGYLIVGLKMGGKEYKAKVHRLVAEAFIPNTKNKPIVNHLDGDKGNNAVNNLEWCTVKENSHHARDTGLLHPARGESSGKHKLSEADVLRIRELIAEGVSLNSIAGLYNVSFTSIRYIAIGKNWAWL